MKLHIQTQIQENYGAHDWDGTGTVPSYWKFKGGQDYMLALDGFNPDHEFADKRLEMIVDGVRDQVESNSDYFREWIISYTIVADDFLTEFEQSQLDYEGTIRFPARQLEETV
jgi:hypothetical protein